MSQTNSNELWQRLDRHRENHGGSLLEALVKDDGLLTAEELWPIIGRLDRESGQYTTPQSVANFVGKLLSDRDAISILDPTCGTGLLLNEVIQYHANATSITGLDINTECVRIARRLLSDKAIIETGDALQHDVTAEWDMIVADLPFGIRLSDPVYVLKGEPPIQGNFHELMTVWAASKLAHNGIAALIVPGSIAFRFERPSRSLQLLHQIGRRITAAIHLPTASRQGTLIDAYLLVIEVGEQGPIFTAQLRDNADHLKQLIKNIRARRRSGPVATGALVAYEEFYGYPILEARETYQKIARHTGWVEYPVAEVFTDYKRNRVETFQSENEQPANVVYLWEHSRQSRALPTLLNESSRNKRCWKLVINTDIADPGFLIEYFNRRFGGYFLAQGEVGSVQPRLSFNRLDELNIHLPPLERQRELLAATHRLTQVRASIDDLEQQLWNEPNSVSDVLREIDGIRIEEHYEEWLDSLPFSLASILWRHQASTAPARTRYEILLHFFEALTAFLATIHISAFSSDKELWSDHADRLCGIMKSKHLSLERSTFGSWRCVTDYFSAHCRELLDTNPDVCQNLFRTQSNATLSCLADKRLGQVLQEANRIRNNFHGHTGAISNAAAENVHAELKDLVERVRQVWGRQWQHYQLVQPGASVFRSGIYHQDVRLVTGTRTPFPHDQFECTEPMDVDNLYLFASDSNRGMRLLPFVRLGSAPEGEANAFYFYSKRDGEVSRFVSYHFEQDAELTAAAETTQGVLGDLQLAILRETE